MSEILVETPIVNIAPSTDNTTDNAIATTTTTATTTPTNTVIVPKKTRKSRLEKLQGENENIQINTTRGKKRAKETYDFMFDQINKEDLLNLFGTDCLGPKEEELRIYFKLFPKQTPNIITKQDLIEFANKAYSNDQVKSIKFDDILKNLDLDESGTIEQEDFVEYLYESITEKSKSMGLIIEISSDEEKPKRKRKTAIKNPIKSTKVKKTTIKPTKTSKSTKVKVAKEKKEKKEKKEIVKKLPKKVKYNFEKYHNTENQLEGGSTANIGGEGKKTMWQYQFNTQWLPYDPKAALVVEDAFQEWLINPNVDVRSVSSGTWAYQVDFKQMTQTNIQHQDHTTRNIRRILI